MRLSTEDLSFLDRLSKSPEGRLLLQLLRAKLAECETSIRRATGEEVFRIQGRLIELDEWISSITTAGQKLNPQRPTRTSAFQPPGQ